MAGLGFGHLKELKQRLLFVVGALIVFRIGAYIPVPGIDPTVLQTLFDQQKGSILGVFNLFSGGALGCMSIFGVDYHAIAGCNRAGAGADQEGR